MATTTSTTMELKKRVRALRHRLSRQLGRLNERCGLLQLPADVILCVADELPLHGQTLLSQTCTALRAVLHRRCASARARLAPDGRARFAAGLAHPLPDYVACASCRGLHRVDVADVPSRSRSRPCQPAPYAFGDDYIVSREHVQLALKYARLLRRHPPPAAALPQPQPRAHLAALLAPHSAASTWFTNRPAAARYTARPRVARGGRFVLFSAWEFYGAAGVPVSPGSIRRLRLCPHLEFYSEPAGELRRRLPTAPPNPLLEAIRETAAAAAAGGPRLRRSACRQCPTDYAVEMAEDKWVFRVWQDFGTEDDGNPFNLCRRLCLWDYDNNKILLYAPHTPGAIEKMYEGS